MAELICLGEVLIDFTPSGKTDGGMLLFARNPGGAPANVAVQVARLGVSSAFMGKVGQDMFGTFLKDTLKTEGVDVTHLLVDSEAATTLAFVQLSDAGDRDFSFYRNPGADTQIRAEELDSAFIAGAKILCFGSLLLTNDPSRSAVYAAVRHAREQGVITAYDPNWRPPLWKSKAEGVARMQSLVDSADIMKVSDEELELITGCKELDAGAAALLGRGVELVVCTLGPEGCVLVTKNARVARPTYDVKVKDTTGSGDSFFGALLAVLIESGEKPGELTETALTELADFANAAGSACATCHGAIPALPTRGQIEKVRKTTPFVNIKNY